MSWDYEKLEACCKDCGKIGFCVRGDDDWGRSSTHWIGFDNVAPSPTDVDRKRADSRDSRAKCSCGSSNIPVGTSLGSCDSSGNLHKTN